MAGWGGQTGGGVAREEGEGQEAPPDGWVARRPEQAPAEGAGWAAFGGIEGGDGRGVNGGISAQNLSSHPEKHLYS